MLQTLYSTHAVMCCVGRDNQDSTDTFADPTLLENLHVNHVRFDCSIINLKTHAGSICLQCLDTVDWASGRASGL